MKKISIIIPNKDNVSYLKKCIESLEKQSFGNYEVIIVDNGSADPEIYDYYYKLHKKSNFLIILNKMDFNYSIMNNLGVKNATGEVLLLLNNDTEFVDPYTLDKMLAYATKSNVGAVGITLLYGNDRIQHIGVTVENLVPRHIFKTSDYSLAKKMDNVIYCHAVTAACLMIEKSKYLSVNGFDEDLEVVYNDIALCLKLLKNNFVNVCINDIFMYHHESVTRKNVRYLDNEKHFYAIWGNYMRDLPKVEQFESVEDSFLPANDEKIFIFGASIAGLNTLKKITEKDKKLEAFIDNDPLKWNTFIDSNKIISFEKFLEEYQPQRCKIIVASTFSNEIYEQIKLSNIESEDVIYL